MNFDQALAYLLRLGHETLTIKFGLENTKGLLEALNRPDLAYPKVQIAGTNGKGSTAVMLDAMCRAAGINTGLYTSPHLVKITERVRIGGREVSDEEFARLTTQISETARRLQTAGVLEELPTFFEHMTAIALCAFRDHKVGLGILETGLGGRLDSTTAAGAEIVAVTSIGLDHQEYLGETIEEIAAEKAAVIRPGVAAVIAPQSPSALAVILRRCTECSVQPILVGEQIQVSDSERSDRRCVTFKSGLDTYENVCLNLPGRHQLINASVAIATVEVLNSRGFDISHDAIIKGLETAEHPGRLEWQNGTPSFLFDGAHNSDGAVALRSYLNEFVDKPISLVFGAMRDKDLSSMASALFPVATHIYLTEIDNPRSASREMLAEVARQEIAAGHATICVNSIAALRAASEHASPDGLICVTGSLYLIGEVQAMLKHQEHEALLENG